MRVGLIVLAFWFAVASSLQAQTVCETNCIVRVGQPVIVFSEAVPNVSVFKLYMNGTPVSVPSAIVNGFIEFYFNSGFSKQGDYTFQMTCVYPDGSEEACTDPNALRVQRGRIKFR